jgi:integrase
MTFRDLGVIYEKQKLVPAVIVDGRKVAGLRSYRSARRFLVPLVAHFGRKQIRTITHSDLEEFKLIRFQTPVTIGKNGADLSDQKGTRQTSKRKRPMKPRKQSSRQRSITAVNRELEMLRTIFSFAEQSDWVAKSPFKKGASLISKASETQRDRVLTLDEEARLLTACSGRRSHLRPLVIAALDTGMRRGELLKLVWPDVDFTLDLIRVRATNTKTERPRTIGMTPRVREVLLALREVAPPNYQGLVFGIKDTVKNGFLSALHEAGIEDFRFHDCRHTAITRMIQAGILATETMKISGHTQFVTFARYVNVNEQAARKGAARLAEHIGQTGASQSQELVH